MRKITTDLEKEAFFVLTDDNSRVLAIVRVQSGEQDITRQVLGAIADDRLAQDLKLLYGNTYDENLKEVPVTWDLHIEQSSLSGSINFDVEMVDEDDPDEPYIYSFSLEKTEVY